MLPAAPATLPLRQDGKQRLSDGYLGVRGFESGTETGVLPRTAIRFRLGSGRVNLDHPVLVRPVSVRQACWPSPPMNWKETVEMHHRRATGKS